MNEIIGNIFILLGAGYETTATTLGWTLYQISKDHALQDRLREEALQIDTSDMANINVDKMPWIFATINEVLRLRAPVGLHLRRCVNNIDVMGKPIRKGTFVEVCVDTLHQSSGPYYTIKF